MTTKYLGYTGIPANADLDAIIASIAGLGSPPATSVIWNAVGVGAVTRSVSDKLRDIIYAKDFGCVGNGIVDDSVNYQKALTAAAGKTLWLDTNARYLLSVEPTAGPNTIIEGNGATFLATSRLHSYLYTASAGLTVRDVKFDQSKSSLAAYVPGDYPTNYNVGVFCDIGSSDVRLEDCTFSNLYTNSVVFYHTTGKITVRGCWFSSPVQTNTTNLQHLQFTTITAKVLIDNCDFDNAAPINASTGVCQIFASGTTNQFIIQNCRSNYGGRDSTGAHQLAAFAFYLDSINVSVLNCRITNTLAQAVRLSNVGMAEVAGCYIDSAAVAQTGNQLISIESVFNVGTQQGCQGIRVHHNTFVEAYDTLRIGIFAGAYDYSTPLEDINIHDNRFVGMKQPVLVGGTYDGLRLARNTIRGANGGQIAVTMEPGGVPMTALNGVTEAQSFCRGLTITDNRWTHTVTGAIPISISHVKGVAYTGAIDTEIVERNTIRPSGASATQAILVRGVAAKGKYIIRDNDCYNYAVGIDVGNGTEAHVDGNTLQLCTTPVLNSGGVTTFTASRNQFASGLLSGTAQLAGGLATIATTEVAQHIDGTYHIQLTPLSSGGAKIGNVVTGAVTPGVGFNIQSLKDDLTPENNDNGIVVWTVDH